MSWSWLFFWRPPCLLRSVVVNLKGTSDTAVSGVLWRSRGAWLVLRKASVIEPHSSPLTVDGEVVIHRSNVSFLQVLP